MPRLVDFAVVPARPSTSPITVMSSPDDSAVETKFHGSPIRRGRGVKLTESEIRKAVETHYPPVLTLAMAATISGYAPSTLKRQLSEGRFKNSAKRKKPVLFWRDRFIQELMQG